MFACCCWLLISHIQVLMHCYIGCLTSFNASKVFHAEGLIYMVQEYGEIDLARLLSKHDTARREAAGAGEQRTLLQDNLDENFIRLYWQQMLQVCCMWQQLSETPGAASVCQDQACT